MKKYLIISILALTVIGGVFYYSRDKINQSNNQPTMKQDNLTSSDYTEAQIEQMLLGKTGDNQQASFWVI